MMHKTTFHTTTGDVLFFPSWILYGRKETYLSCLLLVVLGILYQGIKFARQQYSRKCRNIQCRRYIFNTAHLFQTLMYILQFIWGYILMLSVMTYNLWIFGSVLLGFGLGYFFFGWGEYEEPNAVLYFSRILLPRSYSVRSCGGDVQVSNSTTQELLPLSQSHEDVGFQAGSSTSMRCTCNNTSL